MGWNDIRNAYLPNLDSAYADYHLLSQIDSLQVRRKPEGFSPLARLLGSIVRKKYDSIPYPERYKPLDVIQGPDKNLEKIFVRNIDSIVALNKAHGIKTVFIGQLLNPARLVGDKAYGWLPLVKDKDVWPLQKHFNAVLEQHSKALNVGFISIDVENFKDSDFVDNGHFSIDGSAMFAKLIAPRIQKLCK